MKNIVFLLVVLAIAAFAIAETPTPTPELTTTGAPVTTTDPVTTGAPVTTADPGTTTSTSDPGTTTTSAPGATKYAVFGCKFGSAQNGSGIFLAFHEIGGASLRYSLMHSITNPTAITVYGSDNRDPNAPAFLTLPTNNIAPNTLVTGTATLTGPQLGWMFDGKASVMVATASRNVRGDIGYAPFGGWTYAGILTNIQTATSTSNGVGLMIGGGSGQYFSIDIQHNVTDATRITINNGAACQNGNQLFVMPSTGLLASNVFDTASNSTFEALDAGRAYAVISNPAFPDGAIRGQIYSAAYYNNNRLTGFENKNCQTNLTTTAAPKSSATGVVPSIFLVVVAIIASLIL